jgi:hypothetical protein
MCIEIIICYQKCNFKSFKLKIKWTLGFVIYKNYSIVVISELVLKIRIANSPDPDFIEVEIPEANFSCLLRVCCEELGIPAQRVTRVRKLPNTVVRKDKDVQRLQYLQV